MAAVRSPDPVKLRSSIGVSTSQAWSASTASIRNRPSGASVATTEVTTTIPGPRSRSSRAASTTSDRVPVSCPTRYCSSKRFGVMMSAAATT